MIPGASLHTFRLMLAVVVVLLVMWTVASQRRSFSPEHERVQPSPPSEIHGNLKLGTASEQSPCANPPIAERIVVVVKTGASEAYAKLPTQVLTTLRCVPQLLIVSDLDQEIGSYRLYDVLANVTDDIREHSADFEIYRKQRQLEKQGLIYDVEKMIKPEQKEAAPAWNLDKYKFLHMLDKTWAVHPDKEWYVFIETDTYLVWPILLDWLATLDPKQEHFIGSLITLGKHRFAHGGSGFVMSQPAIRKFTVDHAGAAQATDERMRNNCCGDYMLSLVAKEFGIPVTGVWPMFQGETPWTISYGPAIWCEPVLTMHHMSPGGVDRFWTFENHSQDTSRPLLFRDLYEHFIPHGLPERRDDWDNKCAGDVFGIRDRKADEAKVSYEACEAACESFSDCYQFAYLDGDACRLYRQCFTLGRAADMGDGTKHWRSGWMKKRIEDWLNSPHAVCDRVKWVSQSENNGKHVS